MLEELFEALNELALAYTYFGPGEGDGASFGFWLSQDSIDEAIADGEITKYNDYLPEGAKGYSLVVNDHGNMSLYEGQAEVWAIV